MELNNNGFVIKSLNGNVENFNNTYQGIGKYISWPLEYLDDSMSKELTNEANDKWFGYQDDRLLAVPDIEYIKRYAKHCDTLNIPIICLQVESVNDTLISDKTFPVIENLGFDYADADMSTSCMYDDLNMNDEYVHKLFKPIADNLNQYGLFDDIETVQKYLEIRNILILKGYDMEEYCYPTIVYLKKVSLPTN